MLRTFRFIPNPTATRDLCSSFEAQSAVKKIADEGAALAANNTPVESGEHREDIISEGPEVVDGAAVAYFGSTSHTWHLLEYGSIHNPAFAPFRRAAASLGLTLTDSGAPPDHV